MTVREIAEYLSNIKIELSECTAKEISEIESFFDVKLPLFYKEFLMLMGKQAGPFMKGSSVFYDEVFDLKEGATELLSQNGFISLPDDAFVFWMHQGYQFAFFKLNDDNNNPPIFFYYEGKTKNDFERKEHSFTDFLEKQLIMSGLKEQIG